MNIWEHVFEHAVTSSGKGVDVELLDDKDMHLWSADVWCSADCKAALVWSFDIKFEQAHLGSARYNIA